MPIYEFRCDDCGKISEFLLIKSDGTFIPQCKRCKSKKMSRVLSRVRVIRSEESRMETLADPTKWGGLDEKDPKSMAKWMKKMGKEMGRGYGGRRRPDGGRGHGRGKDFEIRGGRRGLNPNFKAQMSNECQMTQSQMFESWKTELHLYVSLSQSLRASLNILQFWVGYPFKNSRALAA